MKLTSIIKLLFGGLVAVTLSFASVAAFANALSPEIQAAINKKIAESRNPALKQVRPNASSRPFFLSPSNGFQGLPTKLRINPYYEEVTHNGLALLPVATVWVDWGDGSAVQRTPGGGVLEHTYNGRNGKGYNYTGKITYFTNPATIKDLDGNLVEHPAKSFTEEFVYVVWTTDEEAKMLQTRGGRYTAEGVVTPVTCPGYIDANGNCSLLDDTLDSVFSVNGIRTTCNKRCDYDQSPSTGTGIGDVVIDFKNSKIKADFDYLSETSCSTSSDGSSAIATGGWYSLDGVFSLHNRSYGFNSISGSNGSLSYFTCSGRNGGFDYGSRDGHAWAFYMNATKKMDAQLLTDLCAANNRSYFEVRGSNGRVFDNVGCAQDWMLSIPRGTYDWASGGLRIDMKWVFERLPSTNNLPAGGSFEDGTNRALYEKWGAYK